MLVVRELQNDNQTARLEKYQEAYKKLQENMQKEKQNSDEERKQDKLS